MLSQIDPERMSHRDLLAYCYSLEERLRVEAELADAQAIANLRKAFGLTNIQANLLALFADGRMHAKNNLLSMLYPEPDTIPDSRIIDVLICKIRSKLSGSAIVIDTQWGAGYFAVDPKPLRAVMAGGDPEPGASYETRIGRPLSARTRLPIGTIPLRVVKALRARGADNGAVSITMRELGIATGHKFHGASTIVAMAQSEWLKILARPKPGQQGVPWKLQLLPKAFERSA